MDIPGREDVGDRAEMGMEVQDFNGQSVQAFTDQSRCRSVEAS